MDPVLRDGITIDHLTYGYHESAPVLNDVSVRFEAGKSYAIVGTSGSGKSTLVNLLMGSSNDYQAASASISANCAALQRNHSTALFPSCSRTCLSSTIPSATTSRCSATLMRSSCSRPRRRPV